MYVIVAATTYCAAPLTIILLSSHTKRPHLQPPSRKKCVLRIPDLLGLLLSKEKNSYFVLYVNLLNVYEPSLYSCSLVFIPPKIYFYCSCNSCKKILLALFNLHYNGVFSHSPLICHVIAQVFSNCLFCPSLNL